MDTTTERPHHRTTSSNNNNNSSSTSELFVCFTSRLSSSSMKLSSKSILSPSRSRDPPSLSTSLSRRLKSNGSMKGGQASPMFPTGGNGKRRGVGFENPEPSSPKVTCIGQVRVKTKKQGKKMRAATRSKRRGSEASFRKTEQPDLTRQNSQSFQHRNQRWVHLPLTICEALREFTCFFPCRSSCTSSEKEKGMVNGVEGVGGGERSGHGREDGSCGAAFQRWIVALQDGDGNKGRGIELVMQEEDIIEGCENGGGEKTERSYSQRRHVFEDIDIDLVEEKTNEEMKEEEEEEKARVSICIPPKNALLLMRCRSDPVKMAALANRFWESPVHKEHYEKVQDEEEEEEDSGEEEEQEEQEQEGEEEEEEEEDQHNEMEEDEEEQEVERVTKEEKKDCIFETETDAGFVASEEEAKSDVKESHEVETIKNTEESEEIPEEEEENEDEEGNGNGIQKGEIFSCESLFESHADLEKPETHLQEGEEKKENDESSELSSSPAIFTASELENDEAKAKAEESPEAEKSVMAEAESEAEGSTEKEEEEKGTEQSKQSRETEPTHDPNLDPESKERGNGSKLEERERQRLPECLLLMMCEPKLSMEVSKETWVCSTDFIRWLPERPAGKKDGVCGAKVGTVDSSTKPKLKPKLPPQPPMQPPRSSCSFPATSRGAGMSMATMIEQKLVGSKSGNGYEPFVLTRCKSEPMRSAAKLAPDACCWNNRKLEPHPPPAPLGVGAPAGVGF